MNNEIMTPYLSNLLSQLKITLTKFETTCPLYRSIIGGMNLYGKFEDTLFDYVCFLCGIDGLVSVEDAIYVSQIRDCFSVLALDKYIRENRIMRADFGKNVPNIMEEFVMIDNYVLANNIETDAKISNIALQIFIMVGRELARANKNVQSPNKNLIEKAMMKYTLNIHMYMCEKITDYEIGETIRQQHKEKKK